MLYIYMFIYTQYICVCIYIYIYRLEGVYVTLLCWGLGGFSECALSLILPLVSPTQKTGWQLDIQYQSTVVSLVVCSQITAKRLSLLVSHKQRAAFCPNGWGEDTALVER